MLLSSRDSQPVLLLPDDLKELPEVVTQSLRWACQLQSCLPLLVLANTFPVSGLQRNFEDLHVNSKPEPYCTPGGTAGELPLDELTGLASQPYLVGLSI